MTDKVSKFLRGMLLNENPGGFVFFLSRTARKRGSIFLGGCDLLRNHVMVVILLSLLCNHDNLTLKLHQQKSSYPDEEWLFIDIFKVCQKRVLFS